MFRIPWLRLVWSNFLMSYISLCMWIVRKKRFMSRTSKRATLRTCWSRILVFVWVSLSPKFHSSGLNHLWEYERGLAFWVAEWMESGYSCFFFFCFFSVKGLGEWRGFGCVLDRFHPYRMGRMRIVRGEKVLAALIPFFFLLKHDIKWGKNQWRISLYNRLRWDQKMIRRYKVYHVTAFSLEIATNRMCDFTGSDFICVRKYYGYDFMSCWEWLQLKQWV